MEEKSKKQGMKTYLFAEERTVLKVPIMLSV